MRSFRSVDYPTSYGEAADLMGPPVGAIPRAWKELTGSFYLTRPFGIGLQPITGSYYSVPLITWFPNNRILLNSNGILTNIRGQIAANEADDRQFILDVYKRLTLCVPEDIACEGPSAPYFYDPVHLTFANGDRIQFQDLLYLEVFESSRRIVPTTPTSLPAPVAVPS